MRCQDPTHTSSSSGGVEGGFQPVFHVNMPTLPQFTLNQIDMAFHRGAEAQKRASETVASLVQSTPKNSWCILWHFVGLNQSIEISYQKIGVIYRPPKTGMILEWN